MSQYLLDRERTFVTASTRRTLQYITILLHRYVLHNYTYMSTFTHIRLHECDYIYFDRKNIIRCYSIGTSSGSNYTDESQRIVVVISGIHDHSNVDVHGLHTGKRRVKVPKSL